MNLDNRIRIIKKIEKIRNSCVISLVNSDRRVLGIPLPGTTTKLATEAQPFFYKTLEHLGKQNKIDLFLYTTGGQTDSVWPLVSILREYSEEFNVLIPYKAHSAGTLICLGADKVILGRASELSPVDPTTGNQFNPQEEISPTQRKLISVEDVTSYFNLAKNPSKQGDEKNNENFKVSPDLAFEQLVNKVHPLALGNVNRSHTQIRELSKRLLKLNKSSIDDKNIELIVNTLTQGRYSHSDILNRHEVKDLLSEKVVEFPDDEVENLIWKLYLEYEKTMELDNPFVLNVIMGQNKSKEVKLHGSFIDTNKSSYVFRSVSEVRQVSVVPQGYQVNTQPGQELPLIPGFDVNYNISVKELGWVDNLEKV
jgi:ATP-dependent protease ClpP protease subunit